MTNDYTDRLADLKARQLAGEKMPCPRCGRDTMDAEPLHNALSRHADVLVCSSCGMDEALLAMKRRSKPLSEWSCFADSKAPALLPASELISRVMTEQLNFLSTLYERWLDEREYEDFAAYQDAAKHRCPGLTELHSSPFSAVYRAQEGNLTVAFVSDSEGVNVTAKVIPQP